MNETDALFVPTDASGVEYYMEEEFRWPLPHPSGRPGDWLHSGDRDAPSTLTGLPLFSLAGLLGELGERIFVAEIASPSGAGARLAGVVEVDSARLAAETAWNLQAVARFALDCAEHVLVDPGPLRLPSGATLGEVLRSARSWLESSDGDTGLLGRISRIAAAHRLRKRGDDIGDLAFSITLEDEVADVDALGDPDWEAIAAARDAVLAAVEALRHEAVPQLLESWNVRYEEDSGALQPPPEPVETPWGSFVGGRRAGIVPAWVAARDAAVRARDAATDANGTAAGADELAWQLERLRAALGVPVA